MGWTDGKISLPVGTVHWLPAGLYQVALYSTLYLFRKSFISYFLTLTITINVYNVIQWTVLPRTPGGQGPSYGAAAMTVLSENVSTSKCVPARPALPCYRTYYWLGRFLTNRFLFVLNVFSAAHPLLDCTDTNNL